MTDEEFKERVKANFIAIEELRKAQAENAKQFDERLRALEAKRVETARRKTENDEWQVKNTEEETYAEPQNEATRQFDERIKSYREAKARERAETKKKSEERSQVVREAALRFYHYFQKHPYLDDVRFDGVSHSLFSKGYDEDQEQNVVMFTDNLAAFFSVKYDITHSAMEHLIEKEFHSLKYYFFTVHQIQHLYLGIAGMMIEPDALDYANEQGLFVFIQSGENTQPLNPKEFIPTRW